MLGRYFSFVLLQFLLSCRTSAALDRRARPIVTRSQRAGTGSDAGDGSTESATVAASAAAPPFSTSGVQLADASSSDLLQFASLEQTSVTRPSMSTSHASRDALLGTTSVAVTNSTGFTTYVQQTESSLSNQSIFASLPSSSLPSMQTAHPSAASSSAAPLSSSDSMSQELRALSSRLSDFMSFVSSHLGRLETAIMTSASSSASQPSVFPSAFNPAAFDHGPLLQSGPAAKPRPVSSPIPPSGSYSALPTFTDSSRRTEVNFTGVVRNPSTFVVPSPSFQPPVLHPRLPANQPSLNNTLLLACVPP